MKKVMLVIIIGALILCFTGAGLTQETQASKALQTKTVDVDNDGDPDVTYYHDGNVIAKAEADTNNDGKPDVTVYTKDGKFESAEVDTDYDGTPDKKFSDVAEFNAWLNKNNPDFEKHLNQPDWEVAMFRF
ncbi:MAG: hypothetical protein FJZ09_06455 [Candidatus Omnitrophica bacterium]|nr:hypothetical protein [Candidatus Omnitrophota bacterium]